MESKGNILFLEVLETVGMEKHKCCFFFWLEICVFGTHEFCQVAKTVPRFHNGAVIKKKMTCRSERTPNP